MSPVASRQADPGCSAGHIIWPSKRSTLPAKSSTTCWKWATFVHRPAHGRQLCVWFQRRWGIGDLAGTTAPSTTWWFLTTQFLTRQPSSKLILSKCTGRSLWILTASLRPPLSRPSAYLGTRACPLGYKMQHKLFRDFWIPSLTNEMSSSGCAPAQPARLLESTATLLLCCLFIHQMLASVVCIPTSSDRSFPPEAIPSSSLQSIATCHGLKQTHFRHHS